jgi:hypothetical protein
MVAVVGPTEHLPDRPGSRLPAGRAWPGHRWSGRPVLAARRGWARDARARPGSCTGAGQLTVRSRPRRRPAVPRMMRNGQASDRGHRLNPVSLRLAAPFGRQTDRPPSGQTWRASQRRQVCPSSDIRFIGRSEPNRGSSPRSAGRSTGLRSSCPRSFLRQPKSPARWQMSGPWETRRRHRALLRDIAAHARKRETSRRDHHPGTHVVGRNRQDALEGWREWKGTLAAEDYTQAGQRGIRLEVESDKCFPRILMPTYGT